MVTTFVCLAGNRTKELWRFIEEASQTDIKLVELAHSSHNDISSVRAGSRFMFSPVFIGP